MKNKKSLMAVAGIVVVALAAGVIYQQTGNKTDKYPSRDINMVVPWNPGGSTDLTGRWLTPWARAWGQTSWLPIRLAPAVPLVP